MVDIDAIAADQDLGQIDRFPLELVEISLPLLVGAFVLAGAKVETVQAC